MLVPRKYVSILWMCLFTSCATLKKSVLLENEISLTKDNITLINGQYQRGTKECMWSDLVRNLYLICRKGDAVQLSVVNEKHVRVTVLDKENNLNEIDTIRSKIFRGKIKEGHYLFKRRYLIFPLILGNFFFTGRVRIGVLKNGNLSVDHGWFFVGNFMIFPAADIERFNDCEHEKIQM